MTSSTQRLYLITGPNDSKQLVQASTQAQALHAVVKSAYSVTVAAAIDVADLVADGATIVKAGKVEVEAPEPVAVEEAV